MTHSKQVTPYRSNHKPSLSTSIALLAVLTIVSGCQSQPVKRITLQQGMDYQTLLEAYGKPHDQGYIAATEQTSYYWKLSDVRLVQSRHGRSSVNVSPSGTVSPGTSNPYPNTTVQPIYCDLKVLVNQQNKVVSWEAEGLGCRQILFHQI